MSSPLIDWLLEEGNPSVRFYTLTRLLGYSEDSPEAKEAKARLMATGPVDCILSKQEPEGHWGDPGRFYNDKYTGSCWVLLLLAELGADPTDERIGRACDFILDKSYDPESGGFSYTTSAKTGHGIKSGVVPCLTGNMVFSLVRLGRMDDTRVRHAIDWITKYQRADDGIEEAPKGGCYDRYEMCWGKHTCHMGAAKALKALCSIPEAKRNPEVKAKIEELVEYFLKHRIYRKSHDLEVVSRPGWLRFGFPLMYQTDVLELCGLISSLSIADERLEDAMGIISHKRCDDGKWKLETSFNGKTIVPIEKKGAASKWITLKALSTLGLRS